MKTTTIDRCYVNVTVNTAILIALALKAAMEKDADYFQKNPGAIAMIRTLGFSEEELGDKIITTMKDVRRLDKYTTDRIDNAEKYICNVARFLNPAGRAWGIYMNCCLANCKPDVFTTTQTEIFGNCDKVKPLMTLAGVTEFINAFARTEILINDTTYNLARLVLDQVCCFGSPDNNIVAALFPYSIQTKGQLTEQTLIQIVKGLRHEDADIKSVPTQVVETVKQYYANGGQRHGNYPRSLARA